MTMAELKHLTDEQIMRDMELEAENAELTVPNRKRART